MYIHTQTESLIRLKPSDCWYNTVDFDTENMPDVVRKGGSNRKSTLILLYRRNMNPEWIEMMLHSRGYDLWYSRMLYQRYADLAVTEVSNFNRE
jgi:hypothetical protein